MDVTVDFQKIVFTSSYNSHEQKPQNQQYFSTSFRSSKLSEIDFLKYSQEFSVHKILPVTTENK